MNTARREEQGAAGLADALERARAAVRRRREAGKAPALVNAIPPKRDYAGARRAAQRMAAEGQGTGRGGKVQGPTTVAEIVGAPAAAPVKRYEQTGIERGQPAGDRE